MEQHEPSGSRLVQPRVLHSRSDLPPREAHLNDDPDDENDPAPRSRIHANHQTSLQLPWPSPDTSPGKPWSLDSMSAAQFRLLDAPRLRPSANLLSARDRQ